MVDGGQQDGDAPAARKKRVPIILVCSTTDAELAAGAAEALRTRGHEVAVLEGAEADADRLTALVQQYARQGLYVLCRGGELDRNGVDRLRAVLRAEEVPFGRTLTLPTAQGGARGLEERVISVARRMVTGRFEPTTTKAADADVSPEEDAEEADTNVESPAEVPAEPEPESEPEPEADAGGVDEGEVDRWADSLVRGATPVLDPAMAEEVPTSVSGPLQHGSVASPETNPGVPSPDEYERIDKTLVTRHPASEPVADDESSAPSTTPSSLEDDDDLSSLSSFSSTPNLRLIVGGGAALLLIIVLAVALSGSDDSPETPSPTSEDRVAQRQEPPADETPETPEAADAPAAEDNTPLEPAALHDNDPPDPAPAAAEPETAEPETAEPETAEPETAEPETAEPETVELDDEQPEPVRVPTDLRSAVDPGLLEGAPLPDAAPEDRAAIARALEDRELRAWNAFLVAGDDPVKMPFSDAESFCSDLTAGGVSGWRLPSVGELLSLVGAKMLDRKGVFWSETPGDAYGDTRMVVNAKKGSTSAVSTSWEGARPVCVRLRD